MNVFLLVIQVHINIIYFDIHLLKKKIFHWFLLTSDEHEDFKACVNLSVMIKFQ